MFKPVTFADERRLKSPSRWARIDAGKSPSGAIQEQCRQCMQTHTHVADCPDVGCPLFPYRPGADRPDAVQRRPGDVPDYEPLIDAWRTEHPEAVERGKALAAASNPLTCDICLQVDAGLVFRDGVAYCEDCDEDNR